MANLVALLKKNKGVIAGVAGLVAVVVVVVLVLNNAKKKGPKEPMVPSCSKCDNKFVGESARGYYDGPAKNGDWENSCVSGLLDSCLYHCNPHDEEAKQACYNSVASGCAEASNRGVSFTY